MNASLIPPTIRRALPQDQTQIAHLDAALGKINLNSSGFSQFDVVLLTEQNQQVIGISQLYLLPQLNALGFVANIKHLWLAKAEFAEIIYAATEIYAKQQGAIRIETTRSNQLTRTEQTKASFHAKHLL